MRIDQIAAQTWNVDKPIENISARIHDGVENNDESLKKRAEGYIHLLFDASPQSIPTTNANILEIGSGLGWIMQAMNEYLCNQGSPPSKIIGLDIAPNMSAKARTRLGNAKPFVYQLYDGIHIPLEDHSLDLIYSIASLQHIPRPFVFNLFFEIKRLLKYRGYAVLHFLSTGHLQHQEMHCTPWRKEIDNQIYGVEDHWHHFYTAKELEDVLAITGFSYVEVKDSRIGYLIACMAI